MKNFKLFSLSCILIFGLNSNIHAQCTQTVSTYIDFQTPPCGLTCGSPIAPTFQVWGNEAYLISADPGAEYVFEFCTEYDPIANWPATITVADGTDPANPGTIIGTVNGCSLTFTIPASGNVILYVSVQTDCGGAYLQTDNGFPTLDCGPNGATCPPIIDCASGTAGTSTADITTVDFNETFNVTNSGAAIPNQLDESAFRWIITTAPMTTPTDPFNDPAYLGAFGSQSTPYDIAFLNDGTQIPAGTYYFSAIAYGNATVDANTGDVTTDPSCTYVSNELMIELLPNYCPDIFVDASATGLNDGSSWANAFTDLQDALTIVNANSYDCSTDIIVAEGTYYPTTTTSRGIFFSIINDCRIFGGYAAGGAETSTPETTPTILSGDIDGDGTLDGNTFHVATINSGENPTQITAILVDLIIEGGNADNANSFGRSRGGGAYISNATVGMFRCTIRDNFASFGGGVFATLSETTLFADCLITGNEAGNGSALYHSNETNMFIERTRIVDNNSTIRCAVEINNSLYTSIENSVIANNASANANALAFIATNRDQTCDISNSTIIGEIGNRLLVTMQIGFGDELTVNMNNSIVAHQNPNYSNNVKEFNNGILNFNHTHCYFAGENLAKAPSNTGSNALFSDDPAVGDLMLNADYSLMPCSPGVDMGIDTLAPDTMDINGNVRIVGASIDIGAYEAQDACAPARENNSVDEIANTITIFPNPVNDIVNIRTDLEGISVVISDILGRTIVESSNQRSIDISKLLRGTYILQVYQGDELKGTEKLMKN